MSYDWVKKETVTKAPIWCSVDLRDGNQALPVPMSLEEKLKMFDLLVAIGFKEIEVAFPAASDTEFNFLRKLIEEDRIPDDVTIQVITQARPHIIKETFESVKGAKNAIIHLYNSTSKQQREQVFLKSKDEIKQLALDGAKLMNELKETTEGNFKFQYSPESFPGTEVDYALEICNEVLNIWQPSSDNPAIINIPTTVEFAMPHIYACQIEYFNKNLDYRDNITLSIHPHNDRGCSVSDAEFGILAGADRIEGTLFGIGERTGNVDIVTLAMNMYTQGYDPKLNFSDLNNIRSDYEQLTRTETHENQPYSGDLVFTAFSGSHQDAISKGMKYREDNNIEQWDIPYIPVDPEDIGRNYQSDIIRINSQSGKGGISYTLESAYGIKLPYKMKETLSYTIKKESDTQNEELTPEQIYKTFNKQFVNYFPVFEIISYQFSEGQQKVAITVNKDHKYTIQKGQGQGSLDAVNNAIKNYFNLDYELEIYEQYTLGESSTAESISIVGIKTVDNYYWGVGQNRDIMLATIESLVSSVNRLISDK